MLQILQGNCLDVLNTLPEDSIQTIYTCPSPFRYYSQEENEGKIGGEQRLEDYLTNLIQILTLSHRVLKPSGSFFLQIPENFNKIGGMFGMPVIVENKIRTIGLYFLMNRLFWHRKETKQLKNYKEMGFLKNYEYIFHLVKDYDHFYFNSSSKYAKTSVFSYPLEDTYYTNEFDSGLPEELSKMVIDTTTKEGDTVLDPLCGSAKLGVVAKKMNRNFIGIEIDPETVNMCKIRLGI
jgi:DNA modification methylase